LVVRPTAISDEPGAAGLLTEEDAELAQREAHEGGAPAREFNFTSAFALAFSDISPTVGIYSIFAISIALAGPGLFWTMPLVLIGQLMVTAAFGDLNNGVWYLNWAIIIMSVVLGIIGPVMCNRIFRKPVHDASAVNASVPDVERTDYNIGT
jgi:hypothetical protein